MLDHTSEVTVRLRARTYPELVVEAARAFAELVPASVRGGSDRDPRTFRLDAGDRAAGLVDWMNELVYLCEVEQWLPTDLDVTPGGDAHLDIRARGVSLQSAFALVKAATLHRASVTEADDGLVAEVTLDL